MDSQPAFRIHHDDQGHRAGIEQIPVPQPSADEVLLRLHYSGINYKDALAGTGKGKVIKRFPITGGIDAVGEVVESRDARFTPGDIVIATGWGMAFDHDGGYAHYLCAPGDWLVHLPNELDPREAMILGTAGFTAALAVHRLLVNDQTPDLGPVLVTGATGGVGSLAIAMLARLGFEVVAVSGKPDAADWLQALGASRILDRDAVQAGSRPLERSLWGGAIDNVGGDMLAQITRSLVPNGNIAAIGLAGGIALETTVMPFILRGNALLGCNSVDVPRPLRERLWQQLASDWRPADLEAIHAETIGLDGLATRFEAMLAGQTRGRILVELETD